MNIEMRKYYPDWNARIANCAASDQLLGLAHHNPKRARAVAIAAEVRSRRPEMQVRRLTAMKGT